MARTVNPHVDVNISKKTGAITVKFTNENGKTLTAHPRPIDLTSMVVSLLMAGHFSARQTGKFASGPHPLGDTVAHPLPLYRVGALPGSDGQSLTLGLSIGEIEFGVQLDNDMAQSLGQNLINLSSRGAPH